jgi:hypothetical protein
MIKYLDGNIKKEKDGQVRTFRNRYPVSPVFPAYPEWWYRVIIENTGEHFKVRK